MKTIGFYLLGKKGLMVLEGFIRKFGSAKVEYVVIGRDKNVKKDYSRELLLVCEKNKIKYKVFKDIAQNDANVDYVFAVGWRWIINDVSNLIVLHDSLLPKYRGFSPLVNMLINGEQEVGVTALFASAEYDKGDIISQRSCRIEYPIKIARAVDLVSDLYVSLVIQIAKDIFENEMLRSQRQIESEATYSVWRGQDDYFVDWAKSADEIVRFVDAVSFPYDGAKTVCNGRYVAISGAVSVRDVEIINRSDHVGKCIFKDDGDPVIICGQGLVKITQACWREEDSPFTDDLPFRVRFGNYEEK